MVIFEEDHIKKEHHAVNVPGGTSVIGNCVVSERQCKMWYIKGKNTTKCLIKTAAKCGLLLFNALSGPVCSCII